MQKKKKLIQTFLVAFMILLFPGCSPDGAPLVPLVTNTPVSLRKTSTPNPTEDLARIQIEPEALAGIQITVSSAFVGLSATQFSNQVAEFNTLNEWGIVVYPLAMATYNSLYESVSESLNSPEQPDLVITLPEQVLDWDAGAAVINLSPYLNDPQYGFSPEDMGDFAPIFWELAGQDGQQLGLPALLSSSFLFYNQTWAHELGFTRNPLTSAEFRKQACAANQSFRMDSILQNDGYGGWIVNTSPDSILAWMQAFGGGVMEEGQVLFSSVANQSALEFLKRLYDDNCAFLTSEPTPYATFATRSALFMTANLAEIPNQSLAFVQAGNGDEWALIPFPGQLTQVIAEGPVFSVLKSTPEKQLAAWLFIRWLLSSENQTSWVKTTGMLPLRISSLDALNNYSSSHPQWDGAVGTMDKLDVQPQLASWRIARLVLGDATTFMFRNNINADQIPQLLIQMDETVHELIKAKP